MVENCFCKGAPKKMLISLILKMYIIVIIEAFRKSWFSMFSGVNFFFNFEHLNIVDLFIGFVGVCGFNNESNIFNLTLNVVPDIWSGIYRAHTNWCFLASGSATTRTE